MPDYPTVTFSWKIVTVLPSEPPLGRADVFNQSPNTRLFAQFGVSLRDGYVPLALTPTVRFHHALLNLLRRKNGITVAEQKFPYKIFIPQFNDEVIVNLKVRLFLPKIVSLTVALSPLRTDLEPGWLIRSQRLGELTPIMNIVNGTLAMSQTMDHQISENSDFRYRLRIKPFVHLHAVSSPERFRAHVEQNLSKYVGIFIRNPDYEGMDRRLCDRIITKNAEYNLKSAERLLLISKQGVLYVTPSGRLDDFASQHLPRIHDLVEVALVCSAYLENFHDFRAANADLADFFLCKIRTLIEKPDLVFRESVTNRHMWLQLCDEFVLKQQLEHASASVIQLIQEKEKYFNQFPEWWKLSDFGYLLSRSVLEASELHLHFVDDPAFKDMIIDDYIEARRSLAAKNYKAAIVLCGSIAEAVLTFVIVKQNPGLDPDTLYKKGFDDLAKMAKERAIIKDSALLSLLDSIRLYRNMIHPGRAMRSGLTADFSKAQIALETVNLLLKELEKLST
jgi:hypothetical protein